MKLPKHKSKTWNRAFTLVELLVATTVVMLLLVLLASITDATRNTWAYTQGKIEQFREAREAFDSITRRISQATLNTYWDYDNPSEPRNYLRQSELRFASGNDLAGNAGSSPPRPLGSIFFQAPLGFVDPDGTGARTDLGELHNLLNTWGFFVEYNTDSNRPDFLPADNRYRFRLMEMMEPSERLSVYRYTSGVDAQGRPRSSTYNGTQWFTDPLNSATVAKRPIADNIIALVILPKLSPGDQRAGNYSDASLAPQYSYSSTATNSDPNLNPRNQLPPVVQVTMVAVDEASFNRLNAGSTMPNLGLDTLFRDASRYTQDLATLEDRLKAQNLNYRVFTSNVAVKAAKWSRAQTN